MREPQHRPRHARGARQAAGHVGVHRRNFSDDDTEIRIGTPGHPRFNEDLVADLITKKLALENVFFTWRRASKDTYVIVKKHQTSPKMLRPPAPASARSSRRCLSPPR
ncbi:hypothetical protein [Streptomyces sp. NPDC006971]|uniref:hypothetical protein n=1 Tax=Streptomyces sp. NPDC006971 TaxID=3154784 RepID=UPI0033F65D3F